MGNPTIIYKLFGHSSLDGLPPARSIRDPREPDFFETIKAVNLNSLLAGNNLVI